VCKEGGDKKSEGKQSGNEIIEKKVIASNEEELSRDMTAD
jgi:hypothetical protein